MKIFIYIILLLLPTYLLRFQVFHIPTTLLEILIYTTFLFWLAQSLKNKDLFSRIAKIFKIMQPFLWPIALFFASALVALIISPDKILSLGVLKGWFFDPLLFLILFLDLIQTKKQIKKVIFSLLISAFLICLYGLVEYFGKFGLDTDNRLNSIYLPANFVALYIVPIVFLGLPALFKQKKYIGLIILLVILLALYFTHSYGGWIGLITGILYLIYKTRKLTINFFDFKAGLKKSTKKLLYLISILFFIVIIFFEAQNPKFQRIFDWQTRSAVSTRLEIWQTSLLIIDRFPFGTGLGNFETIYQETVPEIKFPPLEWLVNKAHNLYLNLWIEMGGMGLVAFLWLIYVFFKKSTNKKEIFLNLCLNSAMLSILAHGLVDTPYFKNDLSVLFWVIIGIKMIKSYEIKPVAISCKQILA